MPNALIEAMSMELPCIATDCPIGGPKALIEDKKNGILIPPGRKDLLAKAMKELAEDGEMAERIGRAAGKLRERLDADLVADQWRKYLENVKEQ